MLIKIVCSKFSNGTPFQPCFILVLLAILTSHESVAFYSVNSDTVSVTYILSFTVGRRKFASCKNFHNRMFNILVEVPLILQYRCSVVLIGVVNMATQFKSDLKLVVRVKSDLNGENLCNQPTFFTNVAKMVFCNTPEFFNARLEGQHDQN